MIHTEYVNSYNRNYIKIPIHEKKGEKLRYQYQILTTRKLEGVLTVNLHNTNEEQGLYYDITSLQNIKTLLTREKLNREWIDSLTANLQVALWSLEQYLLDERNLLVQANYIFQDIESGKIYFLYDPYYIEENEMDMDSFLSFLVENVDQGEPETVEAIFCIYAKWESMKDQFTFNTFLLLWEKSKVTIGRSEVVAEDEHYEEGSVLNNKQEETMVTKKRNISEFLWGRGRPLKVEEYKATTMQNTLDVEVQKPMDQEQIRTEYMEVSETMEERKLFGNGKQNRKVICLDKLPLVVGKKSNISDVVLRDTTISRMHARFTEIEDQLYLEDLNATNGTFKNGIRLKPYEKVEVLREDEIRLGNLSFTYR
ncbi:MAG TPA: DUF6382 domain-containing protein [Lachnospiraceae bacterium]|nr:DUF6382 domain-containing protein [Lachnospiraceae bacterium]